MGPIEEMIWRNASYEGVTEFRLKVTSGPRTRGDRSDLTTEQRDRLAAGIREALESRGFTIRLEHVRVPE